MRSLGENTAALLQGREIRTALYAELEFRSQDPADPGSPGPVYRLHSGLGESQYLGRPWYGAGSLVRIPPIKTETGVREAGLEITIAAFDPGEVGDHYSGLATTFVHGVWRAAKVAVYRVLLDQHGGVADPDVPNRQFSGIVTGRTISHAANAIELSIMLNSPTVAWDVSDGARYSHQDQVANYPGDRFFENLQNLDRELLWGGVRINTRGHVPVGRDQRRLPT